MPTTGKGPVNPNVKALKTPTGHQLPDDSRQPHDDGRNFIVARVTDQIPPTPPSLKEGGRGEEYWRVYWTHASDWLSMSDAPLVQRLCELWDVYAGCLSMIWADGGPTVKGSATGRNAATRGKQVPHPLLIILRDYNLQLERLESDLGFNPVDRGRIRVERGERGSPLDEWKRSRAQRKTQAA